MSSSVASSSEPSTGAGASDRQLTLNACDDRVFQPRYHLFRSALKLFEDEATLGDNTKIKNGAGLWQAVVTIIR